jgi:dTDP-glucose 4,6-dehydratase
MMVKAAGNTYGLPFIITRTMNIFGERQHPEKFIPLCIKAARDGTRVKIHANKTKTEAGSRFYIHARNVADAYCHLLEHGEIGESYHIVGEREINNLALAMMIGEIQGKTISYEMVDFHSSRPGHDLRYALNGDKMKSIGWVPPKSFYDSLAKTVEWTLEHPEWLDEGEKDAEGIYRLRSRRSYRV